MWGIHRDRWTPRTKGQLRGICFHLMTSSCLTKEAMWYKGAYIKYIYVCHQLIKAFVLVQNSKYTSPFTNKLAHWGRVTHICVIKLTIIGSDNGLSPGRRQAIISTNAGLLLIGPLGTNFSEILIEIITFSFKKMRLKVSSAKRRPIYLGFNVLNIMFCNLNMINRESIAMFPLHIG